MPAVEPTARLDLRGVLCPENYVRTKLELEEMEPGQVLDLILDDGEPMRSVPKSLKGDGHRILSVEPLGAHYRLLVRRGED